MNLHQQYFIHTFNKITKDATINNNNLDWGEQLYFMNEYNELLFLYTVKDKSVLISKPNIFSKFDILYDNPYTEYDVKNIIKCLFETKFKLVVDNIDTINAENSKKIKEYFLNVINK